MTDEIPFQETVNANGKTSQKQDISSDLQDKINPVHPVNPVRKIASIYILLIVAKTSCALPSQ